MKVRVTRLVNTTEGHNKYWELYLPEDRSFVIRHWGRIGTNGQTKSQWDRGWVPGLVDRKFNEGYTHEWVRDYELTDEQMSQARNYALAHSDVLAITSILSGVMTEISRGHAPTSDGLIIEQTLLLQERP
jgi:hypothetical protein